MRVTLLQSMLHWEDAAANRAMFGQKLANLRGVTDMIILPEMFTTGFSMRSAELAEAMDGQTVAWMREQARSLDAAPVAPVCCVASWLKSTSEIQLSM